MRFAMKLMGTDMLERLAGNAGRGGDAASLCAELAEAEWSCSAEAVAAHPTASVNGRAMRIRIDGGYCVDLLVNYAAGMVLIEYAGSEAAAPTWKSPKRRKAA